MVSVKLGFHSFSPRIEIIDDPKEKLKVLKWYVTTHPTLAKHLIGWDSRTDDAESGLLSPLVKLFQIIRLYEAK